MREQDLLVPSKAVRPETSENEIEVKVKPTTVVLAVSIMFILLLGTFSSKFF